MKIAVVFSGQPRTALISYENLKNTIFTDEHTFTYFGHIWTDSKEETDFRGHRFAQHFEEIDNCLKLYPFEVVALEKQKIFKNLWEQKTGEFCNGYPMLYSIQRACLLFKEYVEISNENFDFVLKVRFDHFLKQKLDFKQLDTNLVYVSGESWGGTIIMDDTLCGASQDNFIKIYDNIFDEYVEKYKNETNLPNAETSFTERLMDLRLYENTIKNHMFNFGINRCKY